MVHFLHQAFDQASRDKTAGHYFSSKGRSLMLKDPESWNFLMALLEDKKLLAPIEIKKLSKYMPAFPCDFETFLNTFSKLASLSLYFQNERRVASKAKSQSRR